MMWCVEVVIERRDPSVPKDRRVPVILGSVPAIVICGYVLGAVSFVLGIVVVGLLVGLLIAGPPINLRLYGGRRDPAALLHASAAVNRRAGTMDVLHGRVKWSLWKRYRDRVAALDIRADEVEHAVVYVRHGLPSSLRLELRLRDGTAHDFVVFESAATVADALRAAE
jgi:hypothetical protein